MAKRGGGGHSVPGIGEAAWLFAPVANPHVKEYFLGWREGSEIGDLLVLGTSTDKRITPALAELLARRAAARS